MFNFKHQEPALLVLADGSVFRGVSIGASGQTIAEVVFNTSTTGYQEILTDPSYYQQIITFTYPHIGNVGVNPDDMESEKIWASGLVIHDLSPIFSNWRANISLDAFLKQQKIVGIAGVDTRRLTRIIREKGSIPGIITTEKIDLTIAVDLAKKFNNLEQNLAQAVSAKKSYSWNFPTLSINQKKPKLKNKQQIVVYDFGVKYQILRLLIDQGCHVTVVPANTSAKEVMAMQPAGVFLSNGPGNPASCLKAIANIKELLENNIPMFGICLGFQLLALACGAKTFKMKFGHHGANHPVKDLENNCVYITSQNHNFAVDEQTLPKCLRITHRSLFDETLQGIEHVSKPAFAFQGHPEASPGPRDIVNLFDKFIAYAQKN